MPIQNENIEFALVHGAVAGLVATLDPRNWFTWSVMDNTVGSYGVTRDASMVAPPYAKLYVRISDLLYFTVTSSIQFVPPTAVYP